MQLCQEHPAALLAIRASRLRTLVLMASDKGSALALEVVLDACRVAAGGPRELRAHIDVPDSKGNSALALAAKNWWAGFGGWGGIWAAARAMNRWQQLPGGI